MHFLYVHVVLTKAFSVSSLAKKAFAPYVDISFFIMKHALMRLHSFSEAMNRRNDSKIKQDRALLSRMVNQCIGVMASLITEGLHVPSAAPCEEIINLVLSLLKVP